MKLTKLQRYTAYCILLEEIEAKYDGICLIWYFLFKEITWHDNETHLRNYLPELWAKRTEKVEVGSRRSWFNSKKERIAALKKCIEQTSPDNK